MYGATNEFMIFPILEIVQKELRKALTGGDFSRIISEINNGSGYIPDPTTASKDIIYDKNILNALESNDYEITFEQNDPSNPKMLTAVVITYGQFLKQKINLIRVGKKLNSVKIVIMRREPISNVTPNPYGMSGGDFVEYVRNKRKWMHYMKIQADESKPQEERDAAQTQMNYLEIRNTELRNIYMVDPLDDLPYEELLKFLQNPLAMDKVDFITYMKNKRISIREHPLVTDALVQKAAEDNDKLRIKYYIDEDIYGYTELKPYLPNPPGLQEDDFVIYMENKRKWKELTEETIPDLEGQIASEIDPVVKADLQRELEAAKVLKQQCEDENEALRNSNFCDPTFTISGWDDTYETLLPYMPKDDSIYSEKVLFNILISLLYDSNGKLEKVTSETGV